MLMEDRSDPRIIIEGGSRDREGLGLAIRLAEIGAADPAEAANQVEWRLGLVAGDERLTLNPAEVVSEHGDVRHAADLAAA